MFNTDQQYVLLLCIISSMYIIFVKGEEKKIAK